MLGVTYNNTTAMKIEGWLRSTIATTKVMDTNCEPEHVTLENSDGIKLETSVDYNLPKFPGSTNFPFHP